MNVLITGGAGFIGSYLCDELLENGCKVVCVDNLELGNKHNLANALGKEGFTFVEGDAADTGFLTKLMKTHSIQKVYHMAANSDIQKSAKCPQTDLKNTFMTTCSVLEAMRECHVKKLFFASTSAVYGEKTEIALSEDCGDLRPISYYGGAKLASEAFISSYAYMNDMDVTIFRFPNVIGGRLTHGVIFDFIRKLKNDNQNLEILGDGTQKKPYLYVKDLTEVIMQVTNANEKGVNIYNIGVESSTTVKEIADMVCAQMKLKNVNYHFTEGNRGWKGDVPCFQYDLSKIHHRGWRARHSSQEAVELTLKSVIGDGEEN